ncbi:hypothetical protein NDU88_004487 [Pleurodeles waltl]|uniref:Uncharacterized protein n=1 Tax=Pleurodeles waltl TaxID=8319 RepID=A0AAV7SJ19_PLEWA|nr:hypothetical protein NDU88_004487 [Pleurodeles waltl]
MAVDQSPTTSGSRRAEPAALCPFGRKSGDSHREEQKRRGKPPGEPQKCRSEDDDREHTRTEPRSHLYRRRSRTPPWRSAEQHQWRGRRPARIPATFQEKRGLSRCEGKEGVDGRGLYNL